MSKKILIVRTSSLGDLVHMLPAMSDIAAHVPGAQIDWIVEENFAEIPGWHRAIRETIPVAHRRWRKHWWSAETRAARAALRRNLDARQYDIVLDMQALMKSIWLVRQTHGLRHGLDMRSAREPLASLFYDVKHTVEFWQPAVTRQRKLAAAALGYTYEGPPDFGLERITDGVEIQPYAVIMPSASRDDKLWPEEDWHKVFGRLREKGLSLKLLSGSPAETARAQKLVQGHPDAEVLPRMSLTEVAKVLAAARIMVGLDSGLTHLSAGLGRPTIGIYKASTPVRTPLEGPAYTASLGERGNAPSAETVLSAVDQALATQAVPLGGDVPA
ncbi:lipopolysaccharide heptosyltransferase I [Parapusillimonas granuli]|uniref:Lipopolysaccharide heptosyltransferase 1 n=1 Tax=Parapusillimonas granuli TaxID=380911 RepID=A0A853G0J4_9BURK|nr:lipopolysaccharide heptosyltransferase I [Parapusillimonas granuli]MBB5215496.1 heptosyltransferase-1 [Parapusillimonas granuli]MEB2400333.1 lipopolysaccharide heptosyltransferase I [Alcaligenaceae bacterium]NYT49837.1 lipopolysaccharide heptosyltransferase I [Parapusillimonas granuli]